MASYLKLTSGFAFKGLILRIIDAVLVGGGFVFFYWLYSDYWSDLHGYAAFLAGCIFLLCANALGIYNLPDQKVRRSTVNGILIAWFSTLAGLLLFAYATKTSVMFSRAAVSTWIISVPVLLWMARRLVDFVHKRAFSNAEQRNVAIVGCSGNAGRFIRNLKDFPEIGITVTGVYLSRLENECNLPEILPDMVKGDTKQLIQDAKNGIYDEIYLALTMKEELELSDLIAELSDCSIPVFFIPDILTLNLMSSHVYNLKGVPIVSVYDAPMDSLDVFVKRLEDVFLSIVILVVVAIPMIVIAIAIKLTSPGPIIFRQRRYGLGGDPIEVWKFRSMSVCDDGQVILQAKKNDPRVTRLGGFLRRTSLDELPQFFNVLKGDMSIVGPRPHAVSHNEFYRKDIRGYMLRHLVKPGITGWAQVNGWRGETDTIDKMEKRIQYDLDYIKNWSVWFDLRIIVLTVIGGFTGKNVY